MADMLCRLICVLGTCVVLCLGAFPKKLQAQAADDRASVVETPESKLWLGGYGTFRLTEKLFWHGELHYRRHGDNNAPFVGRMAQIYNRHGLKYLFADNFSATWGGVLRLNFSPEPGSPDYKALVLEPRIWHQYVFIMPFPRFMVYHRIRLEHRWSRTNRIGSDWIYRNRWRYKFLMKIPLNNPVLSPGTFYLSPDIEIIMQSGKPVVDAPLEDLRLFGLVGYIMNPRIAYSAGMMYTTGQRLWDGDVYRQRWVMRFNCYIALDFRSLEHKIPDIRIAD